MKRLLSSLLVAVAVLVALVPPPLAAAEKHERHPEIHAAIHALEKAKHHLEEAAHDFGGHRKEALEACEQAIRQLHLALDADRG